MSLKRVFNVHLIYPGPLAFVLAFEMKQGIKNRCAFLRGTLYLVNELFPNLQMFSTCYAERPFIMLKQGDKEILTMLKQEEVKI